MFSGRKWDWRLSLSVCASLVVLARADASAAENDPTKWEKDIRAFELEDQQNTPPKEAVLFVGSSSIRLWTNLTSHFPGMKTIRRGFGGSHMEDVNFYADRIVLPYRPAKIVVYEGDNDVASGKGPGRVLRDFQELVKKLHSELPETEIYFIAIKPSPSRWHLADKAREANRLVAEFAESHPKVSYADIWTPMLNEKGRPRKELFTSDDLHINEKGYELWAKVLNEKLSAPSGK